MLSHPFLCYPSSCLVGGKIKRNISTNTIYRNGSNTLPDDKLLRGSARGQLIILENRTRDLKKMRKILNELMTCGVYSEHNFEKTERNLKALNTPEWEKKVIKDTYELLRNESKLLLTQLEMLIKDYKESITEKL